MYDNNSDYLTTNSTKNFIQKPIPQQCCDIISFKIISAENPIGSMKNWGKLSCTICMKEIIELIENS